jgi:hypothetical protein
MRLKLLLLLVLGFSIISPLPAQEAAKKAEKTAASLQSLEERIQLAGKRMAIMVDRLNQLEADASKDPRKAYAKFHENRVEFEEIRVAIRKDGTRLRTDADAHYKTWESELAKRPDSSLKQLSEERMKQAKERYAALTLKMEAARTPVLEASALMSDLDEYLATELTQGSILAAKPIIAQARDAANLSLKALADIQTEFATIRKEISAKK